VVYQATPSITSEPESKTVTENSDVLFQVTSDASDFNWQESTNNGASWSNLSETNTYSGTLSGSLLIKQVPADYNKFRYRCLLNPYGCTAVSASALLTVDSISGIPGQPSAGNLHLINSPNPFSGMTTLGYTVPDKGFVTIKIFSVTGQLMDTPVEGPHLSGTYGVEENFIHLPVGVYFCQYVFKNTTAVYETYRKMVRIN
jgi:hypothetical protein